MGKLGDKAVVGLGCLGEAVVFALGLFVLGNEDACISAFAYHIVLVGP